MPKPNDIFAVKLVSTGRLVSVGDPKLYNNGYTLSSGTTLEPLSMNNAALDNGSMTVTLKVGQYILLKNQAPGGVDTVAHEENGLWKIMDLGENMVRPWVLQRYTPGGNLKLNELFYTVCGDTHTGEVWRLAESISPTAPLGENEITSGVSKLKFVEGPLQATKLQGDVCTDSVPACKVLENGQTFRDAWFRGDVLSYGVECETPGPAVVDVGDGINDSIVNAGKIVGGALVAGLQAVAVVDGTTEYDMTPAATEHISAIALVNGNPAIAQDTPVNLNLITDACEGQSLVIRNISNAKVTVLPLQQSNDLVVPSNNGVTLLFAAGEWHYVSDLADELIGNVLADNCDVLLENGADCENSSLNIGTLSVKANTTLGDADTDDLTVNAKLQAPGIAGETIGLPSWLGLIMASNDSDGSSRLTSTGDSTGPVAGTLISKLTYISRLATVSDDSTNAGADEGEPAYFTLEDGDVAGQLKIINLSQSDQTLLNTASDYSPAYIQGTFADYDHLTMDPEDGSQSLDEVTLMWIGASGWKLIRNEGPAAIFI